MREGFEIGRIVHQKQRLQGSVGDGAARGTFFAVGCIEGVEAGIGNGAFHKRVHAAAVKIGAVALYVGLRGEVSTEGHLFPETFGLIRKNAGSTDFVVDKTADEKRVVANHFSGQTEARTVGEQTIFRIFFKEFRGDFRGCCRQQR